MLKGDNKDFFSESLDDELSKNEDYKDYLDLYDLEHGSDELPKEKKEKRRNVIDKHVYDPTYDPQEEETTLGQRVGSFIKIILISILLAIFIKTFIFRTFKVESGSMENTLMTGDTVMGSVIKNVYHEPQVGDIVVFVPPYKDPMNISSGKVVKKTTGENFKNAIEDLVAGELPKIDEQKYIKRIVGMPGDVISFKNGSLYVNGEKKVEDYVLGKESKELVDSKISFPYTVPKDSYFLLGDNRTNSWDSRGFGAVYRENFVAYGLGVLFPFEDFKIL